MPILDANIGRKRGGQGGPVCKECDTLDNGQKFLDLMECVFAVTKNGHIFLTVEECVAYGTVAYTVAFQFGHACDRVLVAGCACCHDANFSVVFAYETFSGKSLAVKHEVGDFVIGDVRSQGYSLFVAHFQKLFSGKRLFKSIIVLDHVGLGECTSVFAHQLNRKACSQTIECS